MDDADLEKMSYTDITRILREVPGVNIREEDGYGLRPNIGIRGGDPNRSQKVVLMEDGILIAPAPYAAPAAYYFPMTTRLQAVEVFKGPAAIPYGPNNIGGAVNVVTRSIPEIEEGALDLELGSFGYRKFQTYYGNTWGSFSGLIDMVEMGTDGFKELPNTPDKTGFLGLDKDRGTGFVKNDILTKFKYTWENSRNYHHLLLKGGYSKESADETYMGLTPQDFAANPYQRYAGSANDHLDTIHHQVSLEHFWENNKGVSLTTTLYDNYFWRDWEKYANMGSFADMIQPNTKKIFYHPEGFEHDWLRVIKGELNTPIHDDFRPWLWVTNNERSFRSRGIQSKLNFSIDFENVSHNVEVGIRLHEDHIKLTHRWNGYDMVDGKMVLRPDYAIIHDDELNTGKSIASYVLDKIEMGKLTISPGLRFEHIKAEHIPGNPDSSFTTEPAERSDDLVSPGIGFRYQYKPQLSFIGGAHKGFTLVSPSNKANLEESLNYEAGWRYYRNGFVFDGVGFLSDYTNIKGTCAQSSGCDATNVGKDFNGGAAIIYGLENTLGYDHQLSVDHTLHMALQQTYTIAEFDNDFESSSQIWGKGPIKKGDPLPYIPEYQASLSLGLTATKWDFNLLGKYVSKVFDQSAEQSETSNGLLPRQTLPAYSIADFSSKYRLTSKLQMRFSVDNITNKAYPVSLAPFGSRPGKPRSFILGMRASL